MVSQAAFACTACAYSSYMCDVLQQHGDPPARKQSTPPANRHVSVLLSCRTGAISLVDAALGRRALQQTGKVSG